MVASFEQEEMREDVNIITLSAGEITPNFNQALRLAYVLRWNFHAGRRPRRVW